MSSASLFDLESYDYPFDPALIAQYPTAQRDAARLMVINRAQGTITHDVFRNIATYLPQKVAFVVNNSKVIPARLLGKKQSTGAAVEVFLLSSLKDGSRFQALLKPLKRIKEGEILEFVEGVTAVLEDKERGIVCFNKPNIIEYLQSIGHMPLPPYIKRPDESRDKVDYQTVYAKEQGSVAAPTAGLHFTDDLIGALKTQGHSFLELTLHINYGTFKPVECSDIRQHPMHTEYYSIHKETLEGIAQAKASHTPIVAIGTTSCRVLESPALYGASVGETNIFMYPGFVFKSTDMLVTNFHLPRSTLLMLVSAFGGYDVIKKAYSEALKERYRFYSYGDAMLIV